MVFDRKKLERLMQAKYGWYFAILLLVVSIFSNTGIRQLVKIRWDIYKNKKDIKELEIQNNALRAKISEIKQNPRMMEVYARSKLGMVRSDEIVYEIK
ncbi:MAG TPA: septum formation initiator family protein [bacterium]|nr:septum formation initiator family protein [bacterium]